MTAPSRTCPCLDEHAPRFRPPKPKVYHRAHLISANGDVSALCFARPRAIDLSRALWTTIDDAVTCPKCLRAMGRR